MQASLEVAIFGMGDQSGYADNYCDAMDELASCFEKQGATIVGAWSSEGYEHEDSKSPLAESGLWATGAGVLTLCHLKRWPPLALRWNRRKESVERLHAS